MEGFGKLIIVFNYFCKKPHLNLWEGSEYVSDFKYVRVLNIRKFSYIWQGSKYASGCNYGRVLSIPGFRVCQVFAYASVAQGFENGWIMFYGRLLICLINVSQCFKLSSGSIYARGQNMARLWICEGCTGCWICLNKPEYALIMS